MLRWTLNAWFEVSHVMLGLIKNVRLTSKCSSSENIKMEKSRLLTCSDIKENAIFFWKIKEKKKKRKCNKGKKL